MKIGACHGGRIGCVLLVFAATACLLASCSPTVTSIEPRPAFVGDVVTIQGLFFGPTQGSSTVTFNGVNAGPAVSWSDTSIRIPIPFGATSGPVVVTVAGRQSNPWEYIISEVVRYGCTFPSLALDPEGNPHVSCFDPVEKDLIYLTRTGVAEWTSEIVDAEGDVGRFNSLALDQTGVPHISYFDGPTGSLKYATKDALGWHIEIVDHGYNDGFISWTAGIGTSIAICSGGLPKIAYIGQASTSPSPGSNWLILKYAWLSEGLWSTEEVFSTLGYQVNSLGLSMKITDDDIPRIAHGRDWISTPGSLYYSFKTGSTWTTQEVVEWTIYDSPGHAPSLAFDGTGSPCISHYDSFGKNLEYAYWEDGSWRNETVDSGGDVGRYNALAVTSSGVPIICYYDAQQGDLKKAFKNGLGSWHIEVLAAEGDAGSYEQMILDAQDRIYSVYYHLPTGGLVYDAP